MSEKQADLFCFICDAPIKKNFKHFISYEQNLKQSAEKRNPKCVCERCFCLVRSFSGELEDRFDLLPRGSVGASGFSSLVRSPVIDELRKGNYEILYAVFIDLRVLNS